MRKPRYDRALVGIGTAIVIAMAAADLRAMDYSQFKSRMQEQFAREQARLSLSPEAKRRFEAIIDASIDRRVAILEKDGVNPEGKNRLSVLQPALPEIEAENTALRADVAKVLSDDQLRTFDTISDSIRKQLVAQLLGR